MGLAPRTGQVGGRQLTVGGLLWTVVVTSRDQIYQGPRPGRRCSTSSPPQVSTSTLAGLQEPVLGFRQAEKLSTKGPSENGSAIPMSVWCRLEHPQSWDRRARGDVPFPRRHDPKMEEGWFVLPASLCDMQSGNLGAEPQCCPPQSREELTSTCWTAVRVKAGPLVAVNRSIFETC